MDEEAIDKADAFHHDAAESQDEYAENSSIAEINADTGPLVVINADKMVVRYGCPGDGGNHHLIPENETAGGSGGVRDKHKRGETPDGGGKQEKGEDLVHSSLSLLQDYYEQGDKYEGTD
jgi:hypothetical protein